MGEDERIRTVEYLEVGKIYKSIVIDGDFDDGDGMNVLILAKDEERIFSLLYPEDHEKDTKEDLEKIKKLSIEDLGESLGYYINEDIDEDIVVYTITKKDIRTIHGFIIEFEEVEDEK
jgi:hypothetical protein